MSEHDAECEVERNSSENACGCDLRAQIEALRARVKTAEAVAAADGTLHSAIDHWQARAEQAERDAARRLELLREAREAVEFEAKMAGLMYALDHQEVRNALRDRIDAELGDQP